MSRFAYVDTSVILSIALGETGSQALSRRLARYKRLISSNLLEAELRGAFAREKVEYLPQTVAAISWVIPDRPLSEEIARVLTAGYVRGADCWHLATALFVAGEEASDLRFLTLDIRQERVAKAIGFHV